MARSISTSECISGLAELLERSSRGDARSFAELYKRTKNKMFKTVLMLSPCPVECEDIVQEGYVKIWRKAVLFDARRASPITWMSAIMRNTAIDTLRRRRISSSDFDETLSVANSVNRAEWDEFDLDLTEPIVVEALNALSSDMRRLIELAYLDGESRAALSHRFGVPVGTIKTWLRRSLQSVKRRCLAATQGLDAMAA